MTLPRRHGSIRPMVLAVLLSALAVAPRFVALEARPLMHDEGQDCFFSYSAMVNGHYTFSPILHGPYLQISTAWLFSVLGDRVAVARGYVAVCSLLVLAAMIALLPRRVRLWAAPLIVLSPVLLYYSRFFRAEMIFNAFLMAGVLGVIRSLQPGPARASWAVLGPAALLMLLAIKINALFVYATGATFIVAWWLVRRLWRGPALALRVPAARRRPSAKRLKRRGLRAGAAARSIPSVDRPLDWPVMTGWMAGAAVGAVLVLFFYGVSGKVKGEFTPFENLRVMWDYWFGQHREQRIAGPLHYYVPILLTYEWPVLALTAVALGLDAVRTTRRAALYAAALAGWGVVWVLWRLLPPQEGIVQHALALLHLAPNASALLLGAIIVPLLVWSILMIKEHKPLAGWMGWWAACAWFQYSTAGEKVPWLAVYILMPMQMTAAWAWAARWRALGPLLRRGAGALVVVGAVLMIWNDLFLIDLPGVPSRSADPREVIVYNHTTPEFVNFCLERLRRWEAMSDVVPLAQRKVLLSGPPEWPSYWYFRKCRVYYSQNLEPDADLMLCDEHRLPEIAATLDPAQWRWGELPLRDAWIASFPRERPLRAWWRYYWLRETWTPTGAHRVGFIEPIRPGQSAGESDVGAR